MCCARRLECNLRCTSAWCEYSRSDIDEEIADEEIPTDYDSEQSAESIRYSKQQQRGKTPVSHISRRISIRHHCLGTLSLRTLPNLPQVHEGLMSGLSFSDRSVEDSQVLDGYDHVEPVKV